MTKPAASCGDRTAPRHRKFCVAGRAVLLRLATAWILGLIAVTCTPRTLTPMESVPEAEAASSVVVPSLLALAPRHPSRVLRGDWEPPETLLLAYEHQWPHVLGELVAASRSDARVVVVLKPEQDREREVHRWLDTLDVETLVLQHDSPWIRDYGPFEVRDEDGRWRWADMAYDAERPLDDFLPEALGRLAGMTVERYRLYLDGGGLISNGAGHCAMTETSFSSFAGTAPLDTAIEAIEKLGCEVLTIVPPLSDEETGHIDVLAQFLSAEVVAVAEIDAGTRPTDARALDRTVELLLAGAEHLKQRLRIVRVPLVVKDGTYFSYVNGTRLSRTFLVPAYLAVPEPLEALAYRRLESGLPRDVALAPVFVDEIVELGGAIHCVTLGVGTQLPEPPGRKSASEEELPL